ncbi:H+/Cl- antiporter ClcA [Rhizomicrobium palustre]|uniref:H+/Cl- antiporter ClcA n=1 Tax=Rhizomicrobium palustre TaxID=189966 RepID=A0A846N227_9PROT|nr:chloride channel protein [Rhizomicrobium palustre]NIK89535.1 H+/Cl- antiporter ClcA [Rhizomicrobium palustre]
MFASFRKALLARAFNPHHQRLLLLHSVKWRQRLTFLIGGLAVGLTAVGLALGSDAAQAIFRSQIAKWPYLPLIVTPLGFVLALFLTLRFFPNCQGSGIPQAIAARASTDWEHRSTLVGLRPAIGKVFLTLFGLLVGASTGREGPTVQVGASTMFLAGYLSPQRQSGLILAGSAAGVAAAFNTPLAGIVFAIEEMSRSFEMRTSGLIIAAVIIAGLTAQALMGNYTYFGYTVASLPIGTAWIAVPVCAVVGDLAGGGFSWLLVSGVGCLPVRWRSWISAHPVLFAGLCGFGLALCGLASGSAVYGTGYDQAKMVLHHSGTLSLLYAPLKLIATALSSLSGIPGGIFSPSLSIGAGIGADVAHFFHHAAPGPIVLLGMVAYFTGVVRAPITGFVIVSEMTGDHGMLVPLMTTALLANLVAGAINRDGVYHLLAARFHQKSTAE